MGQSAHISQRGCTEAKSDTAEWEADATSPVLTLWAATRAPEPKAKIVPKGSGAAQSIPDAAAEGIRRQHGLLELTRAVQHRARDAVSV